MQRLCLDGTAIKEFSSSIESPSSLVELNLKDCLRLESLPSSVCNLESLHHLTLSGLSNLKFVLGIPCNIKELHLDGTAIKELSSSIENASSLVRLTLKDCSSLESLPDGICKLKSLRYLCISGCSKLARLPEDIGNLKSLEVLEANGVTIRELPLPIVRLENLHDLSLERLERFHSQELLCSLSRAFSGLLFLKRLSLNHCNLTKLLDNIGQLSLLRDLELGGNSFESVPTSIVNLSNLWLLDIRFCIRLQSLPKLPCSILQLKAEGCKLLKALSGLIIPNRGLYNRKFSFINCLNLDWNVLKNVLNDALLEIYSLWLEFRERGVGLPDCVMCFPGSEIPDWFNIQSCGSSIELPQGSFNHKFLGLVFCAIVGVQNYNHSYKGDYHMQIEYELRSKCEDGYSGVSKKLFSVNEPKNIESDHIFPGYNCNTFDFREFSCNTEAIINFSCNKFCLCKITKYTKDNINSQAKIYLKKCGIRLLYTQEFEEPMKRSRFPVFGEEEEQEEVQSKRLKPSKFFKGESGSRSGVHLLPHKKEGEEFSPTTNEPISFTLFNLDEFPGDSIASPISISDSDEDNDGDLVKSQPFTSLDLDDFPQDSVSSPIIIISDSDKDDDG